MSREQCMAWVVYGLLLLLWLGHVGANFVWLKADTRPPFWDTAGHAMTALRVARLPFVTNPPAAIQGLLSGWYPPLVHLVSAPLALLFWPTVDVLLGANALFLGILLLSTYGIASAFGGRKAGLLAAFVISMYPIIYGLTRHYLLEVPLVSMVTLAVWLLIRTEDFERRGVTVECGLSLGLGMLTKWTFVVFVGGPFLVVAVRALRARSRRRLLNLALALILAAVVAAPWYLNNLTTMPFLARLAVAYGRAEGDPAVGSQGSWLFYLFSFVNDQVLLPFALLFVVGLIVLVRRRGYDYAILLLLCWTVLSYAAFSNFPQKDTRFTMPYLPAVAAISALGLIQIRRRELRIGLIALLILYAFFQFAGLTWGLSGRLRGSLLSPWVAVRIGARPLRLYAEGVHIASPPRVEDWQGQAMLYDVMSHREVAADAEPALLMVLPDVAWFEPNVFAYYTMAERLPIHVQRVTGVSRADEARAQVLTSDYVVAKTGDLGPSWSVQDAGLFTEELHDPSSELGRQFELIGEYPLPDGSVGELYAYAQ